MKPYSYNPDPSDLKYPCIMLPVYDNLQLKLYPNILGNKMWGYFDKEKVVTYFFDCVSRKEYETEKFKKPYEERLTEVRHVVSELALFNRFWDMPTDTIKTPYDLMDTYKFYIKELNASGARIYDPDAPYVKEKCKNRELFEMRKT